MSSSSDGGSAAPAAAAADAEPAVGLNALVGRLAGEFGADPATLASVASVFVEVRERAPDLFVPASGTLAAALVDAAAPTESAVDPSEPVYAALGEWALDAEGEPIERMRRDCLRFQSAMTRGALRLYADDAERLRRESLLALQRFNFLQLAVLASLSARGQEEGGVVRTLPTPEYAAFMEIFRTTIESPPAGGQAARPAAAPGREGRAGGPPARTAAGRSVHAARHPAHARRRAAQAGPARPREPRPARLPAAAHRGRGRGDPRREQDPGRAGGADTDRRPLVRARTR